MKKILLAFAFFLIALSVNAQISPVPPIGSASREYLPGDFVHIIVDAPVDTTQITAVMPDSNVISLIQERRSTVWRGIWQVPIDFKKGTYAAKLSAVDVTGNIFEGLSDAFNVGELSLVTLVGKPTLEASIITPPLYEMITVSTPVSLPGQQLEIEQQVANFLRKIISAPTTAPTPELTTPEKEKLIEYNLTAGREKFETGKFGEAAAFFRVVLYLAPQNSEAATHLVQAQEEIRRVEIEQKEFIFRRNLVILILCLFVLVLLLYFLIRRFFFRSKPVQGSALPAAEISPAEQENNWCIRRGWKTNPFDANIFQQLFIGDRKLELDSLKSFIRARIESVGGCAIEPFTEPAIYEIFRISKGNPKSALQICEWAVDKTIERGQNSITAELIKGYEEIKPASILIAEDEEMVRSTLDGILRLGGGYVTDMAVDGQEALKKIKDNTYDLVLLDIAMPKIDGYEVLKQARSIHPRMPMVFISGKASPEKIMESLSAHDLTAFIEKPFAMERVLDVVARALKLR